MSIQFEPRDLGCYISKFQKRDDKVWRNIFPPLYQLSYSGHFGAGGRIRTGDQRITCSFPRIRRERIVTTKFDETYLRALPLSYGPV